MPPFPLPKAMDRPNLHHPRWHRTADTWNEKLGQANRQEGVECVRKVLRNTFCNTLRNTFDRRSA